MWTGSYTVVNHFIDTVNLFIYICEPVHRQCEPVHTQLWTGSWTMWTGSYKIQLHKFGLSKVCSGIAAGMYWQLLTTTLFFSLQFFLFSLGLWGQFKKINISQFKAGIDEVFESYSKFMIVFDMKRCYEILKW